ncbi:MAG: ABC transporter substrate-binding protein [Bacteroidetes bacterium]|nr:ABC transporter substrate-binding protein [Bacteroidota bacterium]MCL5026286.1 ABC transporter substrate-binding protein [Chloroflexota bacterium]
MRSSVYLKVTLFAVVALLGACAPSAATPAPAKPAAPAAATAAPQAPAATAASQTPAATAAPQAPAAATPRQGESPVATVAKVKRGGILVYSRTKNLESLDNVIQQTMDAPGATMLYEHLLTYDLVDPKTAAHELKPQLAESWDVIDPKKIVFKLRKGIKFSDGSDFNAEVVKWNIDRTRTEPKSAGKHLVDTIESVDVVDPYTVRVNLKNPSATAVLKLSNGVSGTGTFAASMASKAAFDKGGADYLHSNPIGTGPMILDQWLPGDRLTLKKRDGYWQNGVDGKPLPYLDGFVDRYITDSAVAFVELRSGTVQFASSIRLADVPAVKSNPDLVYDDWWWAASVRFVYGFSQQDGPFKDNLKLRQAAHYAIDKAQMAKTMGFGLARPDDYVYWNQAILGYDPSVIKYSYDANKAKQLLAEAGYPNGIDITLTTISRDPDRKIAEIAKFMWDAVGLRTKIDLMERTAALAIWKSQKFDVGFAGYTMLPDPDVFAPKNLSCDGGNNLTANCNKEFDACINEAGAIVGNDQKRGEIYKRCMKIVQEDAFKQQGYSEPYFYVYNKSVKGIVAHWADPDVRWAWLDK